MDKERFDAAIKAVSEDSGIGTLGEKTLHRVLKEYFESDPYFREVGINGAVADIYNETGIIEIQTRSFEKLRRKLPIITEKAPVTIVHPLPHVKYLYWIDQTTGETGERHKSPKIGRPIDAARELCKITDWLDKVTVVIMLIDMDEYRNLDGWGNGGKRGSTRAERFPTALYDEIILRSADDYRILIPDGLAAEFTLKQFTKAHKVSPKLANSALTVLRRLGIVSQIGKTGRENLYKVNDPH